MIPESEISKCLEHNVGTHRIGKIFVNEKVLEEYSGKIYKTDTKLSNTRNCKLLKMNANTYYLELMFILLNIS